MTKKLMLMAGMAATILTLTSCVHSSDPKMEQKYARQMLAAVMGNGSETVYTSVNTFITLDPYNPQSTLLEMDMLNVSATQTLKALAVSNMLLGVTTDQLAYQIMPSANTTYSGFGDYHVSTCKTLLSSIVYGSTNSSNASVTMRFDNGAGMMAVSTTLNEFSRTTVTTKDGSIAPYTTKEIDKNIYVFTINPEKRTATMTINFAKFAEKMPRTINLMVENLKVELFPGTNYVRMTLDEGVPYLLNNGVKGDPYPQYTLKNLVCGISSEFTGAVSYDCGDAYSVESILGQFIADDEEN